MNVSKLTAPVAMVARRSLLDNHQTNPLMVAAAARRWFASPPKGQIAPGYQKIKAKYEKFQVDDGVPIHLKGGPFDVFLYYVTLGLCGVGTVMCFEYYYTASFPKKC